MESSLRTGRYIIHFHPISVHFTNALYPVSLLFLALHLATGKDSFRVTYSYLITLAAVSSPVSYLTGYVEWKQKYGGAMVRVFARKLQYGAALIAVGALCALWYWNDPGVLARPGAERALFAALNFSVLPMVVYLGYLGGRLVHWRPH